MLRAAVRRPGARTWLALLLGLAFPLRAWGRGEVLRPAPTLAFPAPTDSNSPAHWDGEVLYLFNSDGQDQGQPRRSKGYQVFDLGKTIDCRYDNAVNGGRWMEATLAADDGLLYGWYHNEPLVVCPSGLTAPRIGAARSDDQGATWTDLGIVLEASGPLACNSPNGYFAGGHGDFSAILDRSGRNVYFLFSAYSGSTLEQGVGLATMSWADRDDPVGKVFKYRSGSFGEPGLGGRLTPVFPAVTGWQEPAPDAFWGPSIHWNSHLEEYVALLNRSCCGPFWPQEGVYISYNPDVADPAGWSVPRKIKDGGDWYPQVLGLDRRARETDKLAGRQARYFQGGVSTEEIAFLRPGENPGGLPPVILPSPGEAGARPAPLLAARAGDDVEVRFGPAGCATDHTLYWARSAGTLGGPLRWSAAVCSLGPAGAARVAPGGVPPGELRAFVVVGTNGASEGSYGQGSSGQERGEAVGLAACDVPQDLLHACHP